ncbi:MAG: hypothetical protein Q4C85_00720 [Actinomyces sp.]|uniref:hypothetical protein n=1 Tax=Actinomyces sp. TaxID=29317 RepID=UPI0026DB46D7|nr:hypothetical protein [Actinomyces sp.]MDO4242286.1 hypothetical protein [Actinomyces sp.]
MTFQSAQSLMEALQSLEFDEALRHGDPRFVDTQEARGSEQTRQRLARKLGWKPETDAFFPPSTKHMLFFGHIGSGKTTELRQYLDHFAESGHYLPVEVNVLTLLDSNNLAYSEVLMAMAEQLLRVLDEQRVNLPKASLDAIRDWFATSTRVMEIITEAGVGVEAGVELGGGLPGLLKLFTRLTSSFKTGASTKDEMRLEIRNRFTQLADAFNSLIGSAEQAMKGCRVVFLIDGTDKLRGEDTDRFFIYDAEQLLAIKTLAIYTAPLHLKYDGRIGGRLDADLVLPMIKLYERTGARCEAGWAAMGDILLRRADRRLFESDDVIRLLIEHSGGHPRELLHLLRLCCELAPGEVIDEATARSAIVHLAADYRRWLTPEDYTLLCEIDRAPEHGGNDERAQRLLHRLALMEYNDGSWRRSHPVVRILEGYLGAAAQ